MYSLLWVPADLGSNFLFQTQGHTKERLSILSQGGDAWQDVEDQTTQRAHVSMSQALDQSMINLHCPANVASGRWPRIVALTWP